MVLNGVVTNLMSFGAFVDVGVHQEGLVHISAITRRYIRDASEALSRGTASQGEGGYRGTGTQAHQLEHERAGTAAPAQRRRTSRPAPHHRRQDGCKKKARPGRSAAARAPPRFAVQAGQSAQTDLSSPLRLPLRRRPHSPRLRQARPPPLRKRPQSAAPALAVATASVASAPPTPGTAVAASATAAQRQPLPETGSCGYPRAAALPRKARRRRRRAAPASRAARREARAARPCQAGRAGQAGLLQVLRQRQAQGTGTGRTRLRTRAGRRFARRSQAGVALAGKRRHDPGRPAPQSRRVHGRKETVVRSIHN